MRTYPLADAFSTATEIPLLIVSVGNAYRFVRDIRLSMPTTPP
jgi:hypothetical protein